MDGTADIWPPRDSNRTAAAMGLLGRNFATWHLRGAIMAPAPIAPGQIWQGPTAFPVLPSAQGALTAVSDAGTDSGGGSGARKIVVIYLNGRLELRMASATMAGLVPVALNKFDQVTQTETADPVLDAFRVVSVDVTVAGSTGNNDGILDTLIGVDLQARIPRTTPVISLAFKNIARPGGFTVPTGFCALIDSLAYTDNIEIAIQARPPRMPWQGAASRVVAFESFPDAQSYGPGTDLRLLFETTAAAPAGRFLMPTATLYLAPSNAGRDTHPEQIPFLSQCGFGL